MTDDSNISIRSFTKGAAPITNKSQLLGASPIQNKGHGGKCCIRNEEMCPLQTKRPCNKRQWQRTSSPKGWLGIKMDLRYYIIIVWIQTPRTFNNAGTLEDRRYNWFIISNPPNQLMMSPNPDTRYGLLPLTLNYLAHMVILVSAIYFCSWWSHKSNTTSYLGIPIDLFWRKLPFPPFLTNWPIWDAKGQVNIDAHGPRFAKQSPKTAKARRRWRVAGNGSLRIFYSQGRGGAETKNVSRREGSNKKTDVLRGSAV